MRVVWLCATVGVLVLLAMFATKEIVRGILIGLVVAVLVWFMS
jgi:hypothetical protein